MKRDTPRDVPVVALRSDRNLETLEALYQSWRELEAGHAAAQRKQSGDRARLDHQGSFVVGAVRAAGVLPGPIDGTGASLAKTGQDLSDFLRDAEQRLLVNREALDVQLAEERASFADRLVRLKREVADRARRFLATVRPRLTLMVRPIDASRSVIHVARLQPDEAVLLLVLLTDKIPSRYDFLFDESTEDVLLGPPSLYAEEGIEAAQTRPRPRELEDKLRAQPQVLPVKGFLPAWIQRPDGGADFFRWLQRGPVMEVEIRDGDTFRNLLARDEAERFAGYLLRLKLEQRVELQIQSD